MYYTQKKKLPKLRCIYYLHSYIRNPRHTKETKLHELKSMLYNIVIIISSTRCGYYLLMANVCKISICIVYIFSYILFKGNKSKFYNNLLSYWAQFIEHPIIIHFLSNRVGVFNWTGTFPYRKYYITKVLVS